MNTSEGEMPSTESAKKTSAAKKVRRSRFVNIA
jgi:hypothetical protein